MMVMISDKLCFGLGLTLIQLSCGILVLPDTPPKGFNTFDSYPGLNHSKVIDLATAMQSQLLPSGYEYLVLDGGWAEDKQGQVMDEYGRSLPDPIRFPLGMKALAAELKTMGLKLGLWNMRGVNIAAVNRSLQIKGTNYTFESPGFVDEKPVGGGPNGSCLWNKPWLGVNKSHPAAQAYYDSRIELYAEWDVAFLKADCMMCGPCYKDEMDMYTAAIKNSPSSIVLSYSPGGGNQPDNGRWVAEETMCSMYRVVTDFHGGWYGWGGLQQAIFIAGNFTAAGLNGANGTFPDNDLLPLGEEWWKPSPTNKNWTPEKAVRGETIITLDMVSRSPLMHSGVLPTDSVTLAYETNPTALQVHAKGSPRVVGYQGNCTCSGGSGSCTIPHDGDRDANSLVTTAEDESCYAIWSSVVAGEFTAVAVFNMGEANGTATINIQDVPQWNSDTTSIAPSSAASLDPSQDYYMVDIWTGEKSGSIVWPLKVAVVSHGSKFIKIVSARCHPNTNRC